MIGKNDIEKAYIGTFLLNGEDKETFGITVDNFYSRNYRYIFSCILRLISESSPIDIVSISEELKLEGWLEDIGGNITLVEIANSNYISSNRQYYASILKEESKRVEVMKISEKLRMVADSGVKINGNIFNMAKELIDLDTLSENQDDLGKDIEDAMSYLEENRGKEMFGPSFGISYLDNYTKGIREGKIYRIGAESNLGKSWLAYNIINNLLEQGKKVAFFTLENDKTMTITNLLANHQKVNPLRIENLEVTPDFAWLDSKKHLLHIIDDCSDLGDIFSRTLQLKPDVVVLDFIGLVNITGVEADKHYTGYAKQVQQFAKREKMSWVDLSNLTMDATPETMKIGGHFYGSGFLRNSNDIGIHMWYYAPYKEWKSKLFEMGGNSEQLEKLKSIQVIQICVTKNRFGNKLHEEVYKIDWNLGGTFIKATEEELTMWKTGF